MKFRTGNEVSSWAIEHALKTNCYAYIIGDGFDLYINSLDSGDSRVSNGNQWEHDWNNINQPPTDAIGRFGYGRSFRGTNTSSYGQKTFTATGTLFWTLAVYQSTVLTGSSLPGITLNIYDGTTLQCFVYFDSNGAIRLFRGDGVLQAAWTAAYLAGRFDHFQIKLIIHGTTGEVHIRKNGASSDDFSLTGLDLTMTANNQATRIRAQEGSGSFGAYTIYMDDVLIYSGDGDAPNDWVGDVRCIQLQPTHDTAQKDFAALALATSLALGTTTNNSTLAVTAGTLVTGERISTTQGGEFTTATVEFNAGFTGNAKLALYMADGDTQTFVTGAAPGHLIAVSNAVVNPVINANTFTFPGAVPYMNGYVYQFVLLTDANCTVKANSSTAPTYNYIVPGGYASGFPTDLATLTTPVTTTRMTAYTTLTASNAGHVNDRAQDALTTYVYDNVVGSFDLYNLMDPFYVPTSIVGVTLRARALKTDAGGRGMKIAGLSGATAFETNEFAIFTTAGPWGQFYHLDPNTGSPWTGAALSALQIGPKISS